MLIRGVFLCFDIDARAVEIAKNEPIYTKKSGDKKLLVTAFLCSFYLRFVLRDKSPYSGVARPNPPDTASICPVV